MQNPINCNISYWLSSYKDAFDEKKIPKRETTTSRAIGEDNVITGPYQNYIKIADCRKKPSEPSEDAETVLQRHPELRNTLFTTPIRYDNLCDAYEKSLLSVYQADICHKGDVVQKGKRSPDEPYIQLPKSWKFCDTTQRWSYRNPKNLIRGKQIRGSIQKEKESNHFTFSDEMQKIMKIQTGQSEYEISIGSLGKYIIDHELHGIVPLV